MYLVHFQVPGVRACRHLTQNSRDLAFRGSAAAPLKSPLRPSRLVKGHAEATTMMKASLREDLFDPLDPGADQSSSRLYRDMYSGRLEKSRAFKRDIQAHSVGQRI